MAPCISFLKSYSMDVLHVHALVMLTHIKRFFYSLQFPGLDTSCVATAPDSDHGHPKSCHPPRYHFCSSGRPQTGLKVQLQISRSPPSPAAAVSY